MLRIISLLLFLLFSLGSTNVNAARGFGATLGTGSTDVVTIGTSLGQTVNASYACWINIRSYAGAVNFIFWDINTSPGASLFFYNQATSGMRFGPAWSSAAGSFEWPRPSAGVWTSEVVIYNASSTANVPTVYQQGILQSPTTAQAPSGSFVTTAASWTIGNRTSPLVLDGSLAECAAWNVLLSANEALALAHGTSPLEVQPSHLIWYLPMFGTQAAELDYGPNHYSITVSGAKYFNHPPADMGSFSP